MSRSFPPESGADGLGFPETHFLGHRSVLQSLSPLNSKHLRQLTKIPGDSRFGGARCLVIVHGRASGRKSGQPGGTDSNYGSGGNQQRRWARFPPVHKLLPVGSHLMVGCHQGAV